RVQRAGRAQAIAVDPTFLAGRALVGAIDPAVDVALAPVLHHIVARGGLAHAAGAHAALAIHGDVAPLAGRARRAGQPPSAVDPGLRPVLPGVAACRRLANVVLTDLALAILIGIARVPVLPGAARVHPACAHPTHPGRAARAAHPPGAAARAARRAR